MNSSYVARSVDLSQISTVFLAFTLRCIRFPRQKKNKYFFLIYHTYIYFAKKKIPPSSEVKCYFFLFLARGGKTGPYNANFSPSKKAG